MLLSYQNSPGVPVNVCNNPVVQVSESEHGVLIMIQAKVECFEEYVSYSDMLDNPW